MGADQTHLRYDFSFASARGFLRSAAHFRNRSTYGGAASRRHSANTGQRRGEVMWEAHTHQNPLLLFRLFGCLLLRYTDRALFLLLFHEPPRNTRARSTGGLTNRSWHLNHTPNIENLQRLA
jgi:hypothetical protein